MQNKLKIIYNFLLKFCFSIGETVEEKAKREKREDRTFRFATLLVLIPWTVAQMFLAMEAGDFMNWIGFIILGALDVLLISSKIRSSLSRLITKISPIFVGFEDFFTKIFYFLVFCICAVGVLWLIVAMGPFWIIAILLFFILVQLIRG